MLADLEAWMLRVAGALVGAVWGSFFNVAIHRWPRQMSVVHPPSHCPSCGAPVRARHNVPVIGWLMLRGRAACCGAKISPRYPVVEVLSAVLGVAVVERWVLDARAGEALAPALLEASLWFAFLGGLLVATFVDLEWMEIPDEVSLPGAALGLATVGLRSGGDAADAALGAGAGFLLVQLVFVWSYERLTGRRGMGEGDAKLLMMIGAFTGWQGALFALVGGAVQGLLVTALLMAAGRGPPRARIEEVAPRPAFSETTRDGLRTSGEVPQAPGNGVEPTVDPVGPMRVPFGPFLSVAAVQWTFFSTHIVDAYLSWLG
ncbi:MAG: prepilin peptidase [Myxococcota bacterium]|nr:prepilin peptidase [Myxococcota bacterium]MDW8363619.1 prepilin peptidase [Myxococcales bacterium]